MKIEGKTICVKRYASPCGELVLGAYEGQLCLCDWTVEPRHCAIISRLQRELRAPIAEGDCEILHAAARQLDDYFSSARRVLKIPVLMVGTDFQCAVWQQLMQIPYGATISYSELAKRMGAPTATRAVANANGANAVSIFVPCHRVIGTNGTLTGYGGGLNAKHFLLNLERE